MSKPDFGPNRESMPGAFPFVSHGSADAHQYVDPGMTLRDYFAATALRSLLHVTGTGWAHAVQLSWEIADAMLAERAKTK